MTAPNEVTPKHPDIGELQRALMSTGRDDWMRLLEIFSPVGVVNTQQLQRATGLSRDAVNRRIQEFTRLAGNGILQRVEQKIQHLQAKGHPPVVYRLGAQGVGLLKANGHPEAHLCKLNETIAITHALATLDVRLAALDQHLSIVTERPIPYAETHNIRPDNLITLSDRVTAIFETEQMASYPEFNRILESVKNKVAFFKTAAAEKISQQVRVLFNLKRGTAWDKTIGLWGRAVTEVAREHHGQFPFALYAMPLSEFLQRADWADPLDTTRWENLLDPAQLSNFALDTPSAADSAAENKLPSLPRELQQPSLRDSTLLMRAYWQEFNSLAPHANEISQAHEFFDLMLVLYTASHHDLANPSSAAQTPRVSLFLLKKYLELHPRLRDALNKAITRGNSSVRWNQGTILHRMQLIANLFLQYHNLRPTRNFLVRPIMAEWNARETQNFNFRVALSPEMIIPPDEELIPSRDQVEWAEIALEWVLLSLFEYADELGLKHPAFW